MSRLMNRFVDGAGTTLSARFQLYPFSSSVPTPAAISMFENCSSLFRRDCCQLMKNPGSEMLLLTTHSGCFCVFAAAAAAAFAFLVDVDV